MPDSGLVEQRPDDRTRGVVPEDAEERDIAAERRDVRRHVGGSAETGVPSRQRDDGYRRLRADLLDVALEVDVQHHVADDPHAEPIDRGEQLVVHRAASTGCARPWQGDAASSSRSSPRNRVDDELAFDDQAAFSSAAGGGLREPMGRRRCPARRPWVAAWIIVAAAVPAFVALDVRGADTGHLDGAVRPRTERVRHGCGVDTEQRGVGGRRAQPVPCDPFDGLGCRTGTGERPLVHALGVPAGEQCAGTGDDVLRRERVPCATTYRREDSGTRPSENEPP